MPQALDLTGRCRSWPPRRTTGERSRHKASPWSTRSSPCRGRRAGGCGAGSAPPASLGSDHAMAHDGCWDHPLLRDRLPASTRDSFAGLMAVADPLLDRLDALPRTVAHHDTQWNNLFVEAGPEGRRTVAIDWSFFGTAPIGEDLGHLIAVDVFHRCVQPRDAEAHAQTATEAYLEGLRAYGWQGDDEDVLFAADVTGALQMLPFAACFVAWLCPEFDEVERWPEEMAEKRVL